MKNKLKISAVPVIALFSLFMFSGVATASEVTGNLSTGISSTLGDTVNGVVVVPPTPTPAAGTYTSAQSVTLAASGAASIRYSTDGTSPSCSAGLVYSSPITINSTQTIKAISCYSGNGSSSVASYAYTLSLVNGGGANVSIDSVTAGQAELPTGATSVVLTNSTVMDLSAGLSGNVVTLQSGVNGQPIVLTNSSVSNVSASIPDGTKIQGPAGWDGKVTPPVTVASSGTAPAGFSVGGTIISIGSPEGTLVFDSPVTILLAGVTGTVGYKPSGSDTWVQITNACGGSYTTPTAPTSPGECYISNGTDTKIVTYHFTTFGSLTANPTPVSNGGGGGSYSSGGGSISIPTTTVTPATPVVTTTTTSNQGQVLGAAAYSFTKALTVGSRGAGVTALQQFLIDNGFSIPAGATGYFGSQTKTAVIAYQKANTLPTTGYVGPLTIALLNKGSVPTTAENTQPANSGLSIGQASAIIGILQAFGADAMTIANVKTALGL